MATRTRYQNSILVILAVITLVFGGVLIYHRTQPGIQFREAFLKQTVTAENTVYSGVCQGEKTAIYITDLDTCTCVQILAGARNWTYFVFPWEGANADENKTPIIITDADGTTLFKGYLRRDNFRDGILVNENGEIDSDSFGIFIYTEYEGPWKNYTPSKLLVAKLATQPSLVCRGSVGLFILMLIAALCVALDVLFPELWFQLKHMLDVRNPEPSDFYIAVQRLGWAIYPVLLAAGYLFAVTALP